MFLDNGSLVAFELVDSYLLDYNPTQKEKYYSDKNIILIHHSVPMLIRKLFCQNQTQTDTYLHTVSLLLSPPLGDKVSNEKGHKLIPFQLLDKINMKKKR